MINMLQNSKASLTTVCTLDTTTPQATDSKHASKETHDENTPLRFLFEGFLFKLPKLKLDLNTCAGR